MARRLVFKYNIHYLIDYPGPPQGLQLQKTNGGRSIQLFWNPPKFDGGTRIIGYDVIVTPEKQIFTSQSTEHLSAGVEIRDHGNYTIQVCSLNEVGRNQTSCSSPHEITIGLYVFCTQVYSLLNVMCQFF